MAYYQNNSYYETPKSNISEALLFRCKNGLRSTEVLLLDKIQQLLGGFKLELAPQKLCESLHFLSEIPMIFFPELAMPPNMSGNLLLTTSPTSLGRVEIPPSSSCRVVQQNMFLHVDGPGTTCYASYTLVGSPTWNLWLWSMTSWPLPDYV